jgi:hypothetical protein
MIGSDSSIRKLARDKPDQKATYIWSYKIEGTPGLTPALNKSETAIIYWQSIRRGAMDIPSVQESIIYDEPGTLSTKVVEQSVPEPGAGEVLIRLYGQALLSDLQHSFLT